MSAHEQFSAEEMQAFKDDRTVQACFSKIIFIQAKIQRLRDWKIETPEDLQSNHLQIQLYSWTIEKLDPKFYAENALYFLPL